MITVNFNAYSKYVTDSLNQWDINQVLRVNGLNLTTAPEVHFSNSTMDKAIVRQSKLENHVVVVNIPNSLLQMPYAIMAHIGIYEGDTFKVIEQVKIPVKPRTRPADYVFEDTDGEVYSYKKLENMIANINETWVEKNAEQVGEFVNGWLDDHPEATTTVQDGAITPEKIADSYSLIKEVVTNAQTDGKNTIFGHATNQIADDVSTSVILGGGSKNYNNIIGGDGANVGTTTENTTAAGTGAHVSVVGGYDNSAGSLSSKIISDHSKTEVGGDGHNAIYGGANHVAKSTASFSMVAGGQNNQVGGYGGFVTGIRNVCSGQGSAVFGYDNECETNGGFIAGAANAIKSLFCTCFGSGNTVEASSNFASVFGNHGVARFVGQQVFTAGRIAKSGDAQTSVMEMHKQTSNGTGTALGVLGSSSGYKLQPNQSVAFTALLIGRDSATTDCASFEIKGLATRGESGSSVVVNSTVNSIGASAGAAAWRISAVNGASDGGVNVYVVGEDNKVINWVMRITLVEVTV